MNNMISPLLALLGLVIVGNVAWAAPGDPVTIRYWGQAMTSIQTKAGLSVVLDPYGLNIGYDDPQVSGDLVLITHEHGDHNNASMVGGKPDVEHGLGADRKVRALDLYLDRAADDAKPVVFPATDGRKPSPSAIRCRTIAAFHDDSGGSQRGADAMWLIEADGVRILHCGDLGQLKLTDPQLAAIGKVDVMLLPVGGVYTVDGRQAVAIVEQVKPRIVVPIHYKTDRLRINLQPVDGFLAALPERFEQQKPAGNALEVKRDDAGKPRVVVLGYRAAQGK